MAIRRRPGSPYWQYDFTVNGRRCRGSTETESRETAKIVEAKLRSDALLGHHTKKKPEGSLDLVCGRYWSEHAHSLPSAYTLEYQIDRLRKGLGRQTLLSELTDNAVAIYVARRRGQVSDSSVNRELTLLRAILRMARDRWGYEVAMPNWPAHWLREPAPRDRYLTAEEADRLIAAAAKHLQPIIRFLLFTGCRLSNCTRLDWSQIDMRSREIWFSQKSKLPGGKPHIVPMSEPCFVLLANLGPQPDGPVFTYKGRPVKSLRHSWATALKKAGIKNFRRHDLRHTAASWMVQNGVPLDVVQQILGHADIRTTQRYAHREDAAKRAAVEAIQSHMSHIGQSPAAQASGKKRESRD